MTEAFDVHELVALGRVGAFAPSPCGGWVAVAVQELDADGAAYQSRLWRVPSDGGAPQLLLEGSFSDKAPDFRPDGTLTFLSNRTDEAHGPDDSPADDAVTQLWALSDDGSLQRLSDEPLGVSRYRWARVGDTCVLESPVLPGVALDRMAEVAQDLKKGPSILRYTSMPVRHWDHWIDDRSLHLILLRNGVRTDLTPGRTERYSELPWHLSDDGSTVAYVERTVGVRRLWAGELRVIDLASGLDRALVSAADLDFALPRLCPDGSVVAARRFAWVRGRAPDPDLVLVPLATGEARVLSGDWDVHASPRCWTLDGGSVLVTAEVQGRGALYAIDAGTGARTVLHEGGTVEAAAVSADAVYVRHSDLLHPPNLRRVDLGSGAVAPLARLDGLEVDLSTQVEVTSIRVPGAGGTPVQSWVLTPRSGGSGKALIWIHGGPIGDWGDIWHWRWCAAMAACAGYVVALPNPRGSLGFGQDFVQGIWGNVWGEACPVDVQAVTDAIAARPDVDADQLIAMGGSFGGYLTNWLGTQTDRFAALVTHASVFDFRAFHAVTDLPAFWAWMFSLDPWKDGDTLEVYNPRAHVDQWTTPTLILHGDKDYRVPVGEGLALFEALQARGVDSELVVFPDENHWILKPRNIVAWYEAWMGFVERTVGGEE